MTGREGETAADAASAAGLQIAQEIHAAWARRFLDAADRVVRRSIATAKMRFRLPRRSGEYTCASVRVRGGPKAQSQASPGQRPGLSG